MCLDAGIHFCQDFCFFGNYCLTLRNQLGCCRIHRIGAGLPNNAAPCRRGASPCHNPSHSDQSQQSPQHRLALPLAGGPQPLPRHGACRGRKLHREPPVAAPLTFPLADGRFRLAVARNRAPDRPAVAFRTVHDQNGWVGLIFNETRRVVSGCLAHTRRRTLHHRTGCKAAGAGPRCRGPRSSPLSPLRAAGSDAQGSRRRDRTPRTDQPPRLHRQWQWPVTGQHHQDPPTRRAAPSRQRRRPRPLSWSSSSR